MPQPKPEQHSVRLSAAIDEREYEELARFGAELGLSAAWLIRRAASEFVARHRDGIAPDLPLRPPELEATGRKTMGGARGE